MNMDPSLSQILTELFRVTQERDQLSEALQRTVSELESLRKEVAASSEKEAIEKD